MTQTFATLDWVLVGGTAALTVLGVFLGVSGQLAVVAGFGAAGVAASMLWRLAFQCAVWMGFSIDAATTPAIIVDLVFALIAFGIARLCVKRFVTGCLGALTNMLLGAVAGALLGCGAVGFLAGIGSAKPGEHGHSPFVAKSVIVSRVAEWADGRPAAAPAATPATAPAATPAAAPAARTPAAPAKRNRKQERKR